MNWCMGGCASKVNGRINFIELNSHWSIIFPSSIWLKTTIHKLYQIVLLRLPKPKCGGWRRHMPGHVLLVAGIRDSSSFLKARAFIILRVVFLFFLSTYIVQERWNISHREEAWWVLHAPDCQWHIDSLWWRIQNCLCCCQQVRPSPNTEPYTPDRRIPCIRKKDIHYVLSRCITQRSYIKGDIHMGIKWFMEEWFRFRWPWVFKGVMPEQIRERTAFAQINRNRRWQCPSVIRLPESANVKQ